MKSMLDAVRSLVTPALTSQISAQTSESQASVSKGLDAMIPALLASVANRSDDSGFINQLVSASTKAAADADVPSSTAIPTGQAALPSSLLGLAAPLMEGVSRYAGLKSSSASTLFSAIVPLILTYFGRQIRSERLDANGVADHLRRERDSFTAAIPPGLANLVPGLGRAPVTAGAAYDDLHRRPVPAATRHRSAASWVFPLVLAALAISGLSWWLNRDRTDRIQADLARTERAIGTAGRVDLFTARLPGNVTLTIPRGGMEDRLIAYLSSPTPQAGGFAFDRIGFVTGSTALTGQSQEQIRTVAQVLNAYPSARVTIEGYTDNVGNESSNLELSRMRASSVMNALAQSGVSPNRMQAQGYGSRNPVADNRSEDGRERNRRVVLRITPS